MSNDHTRLGCDINLEAAKKEDYRHNFVGIGKEEEVFYFYCKEAVFDFIEADCIESFH